MSFNGEYAYAWPLLRLRPDVARLGPSGGNAAAGRFVLTVELIIYSSNGVPERKNRSGTPYLVQVATVSIYCALCEVQLLYAASTFWANSFGVMVPARRSCPA